jgi:tetratricopeptide (TPR) repeat protein
MRRWFSASCAVFVALCAVLYYGVSHFYAQSALTRASVLAAHGLDLMRKGREADAARMLESAVAAYDALPRGFTPGVPIHTVLFNLGRLKAGGSPEAARGLFERALLALPRGAASPLAGLVLEALGDVAPSAGAARDYWERARRALSRAAPPSGGGGGGGEGEGDADAEAAAALAVGDATGDVHALARVELALVTAYQLLAEQASSPAVRARHVERALRLARRSHRHFAGAAPGGALAARAANALAVALGAQGTPEALEEAVEVVESALTLLRAELSGGPLDATLLAAHCALLLRQGKPATALPVCGRALAPATATEGPRSGLVGKLHAYTAAARRALGDGRGALAAGLEAAAVLREAMGEDSRALQNVRLTMQGALELLGATTPGNDAGAVEAAARAALLAR